MDRDAGFLIVEDRSLVANKIKRELERAGMQIAAMAASQEAALDLAERLPLRGAILDVDLRGMSVYPIAEVLRRRRIPFLFLTGYSHAALPAVWQEMLLVEKPFEGDMLIKTLSLAIRGVRAPPSEGRLTTPAIRHAWDRVRHTRDMLTEQRAWAEEHGFTTKPVRQQHP